MTLQDQYHHDNIAMQPATFGLTEPQVEAISDEHPDDYPERTLDAAMRKGWVRVGLAGADHRHPYLHALNRRLAQMALQWMIGKGYVKTTVEVEIGSGLNPGNLRYMELSGQEIYDFLDE